MVGSSTTRSGCAYDGIPRFVHRACKFTGKERDAESGFDYFGARYYGSTMGRYMSPDWSANPEAVPYSKLDNPQSLNLYGYVNNNPLSQIDNDGHETLKPSDWGQQSGVVNPGTPFDRNFGAVLGGAGKILVGGGLVGTAVFGDVPGSTAGAVLVVNTVLGGLSTAGSGVVTITGAVTNTNGSDAQEALSATQNLPGLVTTAVTGGNLKAGDIAATVGNAASLATGPKDAVKNPATAADAAQTVKDTGGLIQQTVNAVRNYLNPTPPTPPAPSTPGCSVAGACQK
jgi:RHS repeat-associated protein